MTETENSFESAQEVEYPFSFTGNATEYFKIWVVNIALTLLTLGVFSAWAKVRSHRYFYGNTYLDGSSFEYLASPIAILKGRTIAVSFFACYWIAVNFIPFLMLPVVLVFLFAFPWVVVRSMTFRARNTCYRNLRFGFNGGYAEVVKTFILWPILIPFTIGLIWPYIHYKQKRMLVANSEFGDTAFAFKAEPKQFYQIYVVAMIMVMVIPIVFSLVAMIMQTVFPELAELRQNGNLDGQSNWLAISLMAVSMLGVIALQYLAYVFVKTRIANLTYSSSVVGDGRLESRLTVAGMMWIYFSNVIAIILSVGLLVPWAKIRLARYRAEHTSLHARGGLDEYRGGVQHSGSALGEEAGEIFDMDISI